MGGELRLKARAREARAMARASEMLPLKNKRKELEVVELSEGDEDRGIASASDVKRSKLNVSSEDRDVTLRREDVNLMRGDVDLRRADVTLRGEDVFLRRGDVGDGDEVSKSGTLMETVGRILDARRRKSTRPLPALMGEKAVDLIALHSRVNSMGGYSKVTEAKLWGSISDALGLGQECGPGLKLVFVKYLKALETNRYPRDGGLDASQPSSSEPRTQSGRVGGWLEARHENGEFWSREAIQVNRFDGGRRNEGDSGGDDPRASLSDDEIIGDLRSRHRQSQLECRQSSTSEDWATTYTSVEHSERNPSDRGNQNQAHGSSPGASEDWYEGGRQENVVHQREALNGMMEWIKRVALSPGDPSIGVGTPGSGQDEDWVSQCQMLTAKVRSVLWKEPRGGDSSMQAKQMPSVYYDEPVRPDAQALERLRVTRERLAQFGFQPPPGPKSNHQDRNDGSYWGAPGAYVGHRSGRQTVNYNEAAFARYNQHRKRIPIGHDFQADEVRWPWVPREQLHRSGDTPHGELGGEGPSGSDDDDDDDDDDEDNDDTRWLGVRVWPPPEQEGIISSSLIRVGRGRAPSCDCSEPGSMNCVRVHVAEARSRLRVELGQHAWVEMGFDQMGECVADQWTKDEERTFRLVARTHPVSKNSNFWDHLPDAFPFKTRRELNSYYFNVFILRRRALQNRLREVKVDSDDDEGELPGESDDSGYDSTDEEDDEEEDEDDLSDGADDAGSEDMPDAVYPLKTPMDSLRVPKYRAIPDFNFIPSEPEVARIDGAQISELEADNHVSDHAHDDSHVVMVWDDKHLESSSLVRGGAISQEWQEPHWDSVREHQQEAVTSSRQLSPPIGKDVDVRQAPALGDLWSQSMEMAPKREKDRLLSTNGMILELFGDDVSI